MKRNFEQFNLPEHRRMDYEAELKNDVVVITGKCKFTNLPVVFEVQLNEYQNYLKGKLNIQNAMPSVPPEYREFFLSGIGPQGWRQMFGMGLSDDDDNVNDFENDGS